MIQNFYLAFSLFSLIGFLGCNPAIPSTCSKSKAYKHALMNLSQAQMHNAALIDTTGPTSANEVTQTVWLETFAGWASSTKDYLAALAQDTGISAAANTAQDYATKYATAAKEFIEDAISDPSSLTSSVKDAFWGAQKNLTDSMQNITEKLGLNAPADEKNDISYLQAAANITNMVSVAIASAATSVYADPVGTITGLYDSMAATISNTTGINKEPFLAKAKTLYDDASKFVTDLKGKTGLDADTDKKLDQLNQEAEELVHELQEAIPPKGC